jgi:hypothetical protein
MADYDVTFPDGSSHVITAPDGASQNDVLEFAHQQYTSSPRGKAEAISKTLPGGDLVKGNDTPLTQAGDRFNKETAKNFDSSVNMMKRGGQNFDQGVGSLVRGGNIGSFLQALKGTGQGALGAVGAAGAGLDPALREFVGNPVHDESKALTGGKIAIPAGATDALVELGPGVEELLNAVTGAAKRVPGMLGSLAKSDAIPGAQEAVQAGYKIPPSMASNNPSGLSDKLGAVAGKAQLEQKAATLNQANHNVLAARDLGLPEDTILTPEVYDKVIGDAGEKKDAIVKSLPQINTNINDDFLNKMVKIRYGDRATPSKFKSSENPQINKMVDELLEETSHTPQDVMDKVRELRFDADQNFKAQGDPGKMRLAQAQKSAAAALEDAVEDNLKTTNNPDLLNQYRQLRTLQAKAYNLRDATNPTTGNVSASKMAGLLRKREPLTDGSKQIAQFGAGFGRAARDPQTFGGSRATTTPDMAYAWYDPRYLLAQLLRPAAKGTVLSDPYQRAMVGLNNPKLPTAVTGNPASYLSAVPNYADMINKSNDQKTPDN